MRAVITFHSIDDSGSVLSFPTRGFAYFVSALMRNDVPIVTYDKLLTLKRGITLTFDDGMQSVRDHALPVLREHGVPAHLFVVSDHVGATNRWPTQPANAPDYKLLNWDGIAACAAGGFTIESHTASHPDLTQVDADEIRRQCLQANNAIRQHIGAAPTLFAYPYGYHDNRVHKAIEGLYAACFTTRLAYLPHAPQSVAVPRLDSYYLQTPWCRDRPLAAHVRGYLACRAMLRRLRGGE
jgi:peptidoglycan/xylan/chitin deacetylase (PgdA/CDA1 family)